MSSPLAVLVVRLGLPKTVYPPVGSLMGWVVGGVTDGFTMARYELKMTVYPLVRSPSRCPIIPLHGIFIFFDPGVQSNYSKSIVKRTQSSSTIPNRDFSSLAPIIV